MQVGSQQPQQPPLLADVDHRDLDGPVQARAAVANAPQQIDRRLQHVIGGQHVVAKSLAAALDVPGQSHLLVAVEHGNLAHLHQVDADRIVDLVVVAGLFFGGLVPQTGLQFVVLPGLNVVALVVRQAGGFGLDGLRLGQFVLHGNLLAARGPADQGRRPFAMGLFGSQRLGWGFRHGRFLATREKGRQRLEQLPHVQGSSSGAKIRVGRHPSP